jgi:putative nucleotidyltransferase with HDIG domain
METTDPLIISCKTGEALQIALKHRDEYTQYHCQRVANIAVLTGKYLGLNDEALSSLETAAIFHDIGKIGMPDEILLNTGSLNSEQYETMKTHAIVGASIAEKLDIKNADEVATIIRHHHEHYDGSGYPDGLKGEEIPLSSRIICIVDVFDALTSRRRYRDPIGFEHTLEEMAQTMANQFDPTLFDVIAKIIKQTLIKESSE